MNTGTRAAVPIPPKQVKPSARNTRAPTARAATAAATPAEPPPHTITSVSIFTGSERKYSILPFPPDVHCALATAGIPPHITAIAVPLRKSALRMAMSFIFVSFLLFTKK
jgi:hypothetical protein